jgi:hypothetical protein
MGKVKVKGGDKPFISLPQGVILVEHLEQLSQAMVDNLTASNQQPTDTSREKLSADAAEEVSQNSK